MNLKSRLIRLFAFVFALIIANIGMTHTVRAANSGIFTIEAWVKPETSVASKAIVGKAEELRVFTDASGNPGCQFKSTTWQVAVSGSTALTTGAWSHVACTYDKTNIKIYVNGIGVGSSAQTAVIDDTANALKYGLDDSTDTPYSAFKGTIDELTFYNYARSAKQIQEDMNLHSPVSASGKNTVAYYKFDEGSGSIAHNSSLQGEALEAQLGTGSSAPTWSNNGEFGKALSFDGSNDYVSMPNQFSFSNFTTSFWMKVTSVPNSANDQYILHIGSGTDTSNYRPLIGIDNSSNNLFDLGVWGNTNFTTDIKYNINTWYHIVVSHNEGASTKIYVNGSFTASSSTVTFTDASNDYLTLGNLRGYNQSFFNGLIDEVKIYNHVLTDDEVRTEYNRGSALVLGTTSTGTGNTAPASASSQKYCVPGDTATCSPPVAEWNFDEGSGTSANDSSGNSNTGTLGTGSSAPTWTTGKVGKALNFDGNDSLTTGTALSNFITASAGTIEAWIKPTGSSATSGQGYNLPTVIGDSQGFVYISRGIVGGLDRIWFGNWDSGEDKVGISYTNDVWVHVTWVHSGGNLYAYANGQLISSTASGDTGTITNNLLIGKGYSSFFNGQIDQIRIFNYARTAAQIAWDYNQGEPVAHYKFNECQGTTAHSSSTTDYSGTITIGSSGTQSQLGTCSVGTGSTAAWGNGSSGKYGASLNFDGTDDYVSVGTGVTAQSVGFWVYPSTTSQSFLQLNSTATVTSSNGVVSAGAGFSSPTIYINGKTNGTITASAWNQVVVTTETAINANAIKLGLVGSTYYNGQIDEVRVYNYPLTPLQVKTLYNSGSSVYFGN